MHYLLIIALFCPCDAIFRRSLLAFIVTLLVLGSWPLGYRSTCLYKSYISHSIFSEVINGVFFLAFVINCIVLKLGFHSRPVILLIFFFISGIWRIVNILQYIYLTVFNIIYMCVVIWYEWVSVAVGRYISFFYTKSNITMHELEMNVGKDLYFTLLIWTWTSFVQNCFFYI